MFDQLFSQIAFLAFMSGKIDCRRVQLLKKSTQTASMRCRLWWRKWNELTSPRMCWRLLLEHLVYWQIHPGTKHDWKWKILSWNNIPCIFNKIWWRLTHSFARHSSLDLYIEITSYCFINPCSLCTIETMCFEDEYMPLWCYSKRKGEKNL